MIRDYPRNGKSYYRKMASHKPSRSNTPKLSEISLPFIQIPLVGKLKMVFGRSLIMPVMMLLAQVLSLLVPVQLHGHLI